MLRQLMTAVIDLLGAIPPVRYVMGLVDARWRPLWAALWLTVIPSILFLTIRLAIRRARHGTLQENETLDGRGVAFGSSAEHTPGNREPEEKSRVLKPGSTPPRSPTETPPSDPARQGGGGIPVSVVLAALVAGALAVAFTALLLLLPNKRGAPGNAASARGDSAAAADTGLDVRWRSGRMDGVDCLGTFEVKRGHSASAQFVAFVMDTSGAIMARDSVQVKSAVVPGLLVDFRFRRVACTRIYDWQLQVTTPKASPK